MLNKLSSSISLNRLFFLYENIINFLKGYYDQFYYYGSLFLNKILFYKGYFFIVLILFVVYKIGSFLWHYRKNLSEFVLYPEPLVRGIWFHIFNNFYQNSITNTLLELEKLLVSLPSSVGIILVIGQEDTLPNVTTMYKDESLSWYFIRNSIYLYVKKNEHIKYIVSFLNRIKNIKPLNSIILKMEINDPINIEILKSISIISGIKAPFYLNIHNISWLENNGIYFTKEEQIGFLFDFHDSISNSIINKNLENLKNILLEKMLLIKEFNSEFSIDFDKYKSIIGEKIIYINSFNYNIIRGVFFTTDREKIPLKNMLRVSENPNTLFLNFYENVVEKELLIGELINQELMFISRYDKYKEKTFLSAIFILIFFTCYINNQIWVFNKRYDTYYHYSENILKLETKSTSYQLYELLEKINQINLNSIRYKFLPHNYLVNNLYNYLCEMEEIFTFTLINQQTDNSKEDMFQNIDKFSEFDKLENYTNRILKLEHTIFNSKEIKRFGIYRKRSRYSTENTKIFFDKSFVKIRSIYSILMTNFFKNYFSSELYENLLEFQNLFTKLFKNSEVTDDEIREVVKTYYKCRNIITIKNNDLQIRRLQILLLRLNKSLIFGPNMVLDTTSQFDLCLKEYESNLSTISNNITGNLVVVDNNKIVISDKLIRLIEDLENFLNEPFMDTINIVGPTLPKNHLISTWNLNILKDGVDVQKKGTDFQKHLDKYSEELRDILFGVFKKRIASSIFSKIGLAQNILPKEHINMQNTLDAFTYINVMLQFFSESGNQDYYNEIINIFLHDFEILDEIIDDMLSDTIFNFESKITGLKKDDTLMFLFATTKTDKIREITNNDMDKLIRVFYNYMEPIFKILNYNHFEKYRSIQYLKYKSIDVEIKKLNKGISNTLGRFQDFILNKLTTYSIYNSFQEGLFEFSNDWDNYLEVKLDSFKKNLLQKSKKIYNEEIVFQYDNFRQSWEHFLSKFPFNKTGFNEKNIIDIETIYNSIQNEKKLILLFQNKNNYNEKLLNAMEKITSIYNNLKKDETGYYIEPSLEIQIGTAHSLHSEYVGLVNISQSKEYSSYFLQKDAKLYFHLPVYIHVEVGLNNVIQIMNIKSSYYTAHVYEKGIYFYFPTIWHFLNYVYQHIETRSNDKITIVLSIPLTINKQIHHIKFHMMLGRFIFFPNILPKI